MPYLMGIYEDTGITITSGILYTYDADANANGDNKSYSDDAST